MELERLAARLGVLEDERSIMRALHDYGRAIDYGDAAAWLNLFAPEARFELRYRPGLAPTRFGAPAGSGNCLVYEGEAMLSGFIHAHTHAPERYHKHVVTGARIELDGDTARCESYFMRVDERNKLPVIVAAGRYLDAFVRSSDARWRFIHRRAEIEARSAAQ